MRSVRTSMWSCHATRLLSGEACEAGRTGDRSIDHACIRSLTHHAVMRSVVRAFAHAIAPVWRVGPGTPVPPPVRASAVWLPRPEHSFGPTAGWYALAGGVDQPSTFPLSAAALPHCTAFHGSCDAATVFHTQQPPRKFCTSDARPGMGDSVRESTIRARIEKEEPVRSTPEHARSCQRGSEVRCGERATMSR